MRRLEPAPGLGFAVTEPALPTRVALVGQGGERHQRGLLIAQRRLRQQVDRVAQAIDREPFGATIPAFTALPVDVKPETAQQLVKALLDLHRTPAVREQGLERTLFSDVLGVRQAACTHLRVHAHTDLEARREAVNQQVDVTRRRTGRAHRFSIRCAARTTLTAWQLRFLEVPAHAGLGHQFVHGLHSFDVREIVLALWLRVNTPTYRLALARSFGISFSPSCTTWAPAWPWLIGLLSTGISDSGSGPPEKSTPITFNTPHHSL